MKINSKIDINVGYRCNARCKFCYYKPFLNDQFFDVELMKKRLRSAKKNGIKDIDITGGEPTMSKDLISIVEYARSLDFNKICLITNGILLADINYFRRIKNAGISDVLFSIHGDTAEMHDSAMGRKGSFSKCLQAIENAGMLGVRIRTNSVVTKINYRHLPGIARLIEKIKPKVASLININPSVCTDTYNMDLVPMLGEIVPYVRESIDILKDKTSVNVMYLPFCLMRGYEPYLHNMHQIQYDPDEWDYLTRAIIQSGSFNTFRFIVLRGILKLPIRCWTALSVSEFLHRAMIEAMCTKNNIKPSQCRKCLYYFICDGPWRDYVSLYGANEIHPAAGKKVYDPAIFMQKEYA